MSMWTFFREFAKDPVLLGAVAPSGADLARRMVDAAELGPGQVVVELGAGTGPMTAEILARRPDGPFVALEPNAALAALPENITAALAQPVDGNDATEWTVYAGRTNGTDLTVEFTRDPGTDRSLDTITIATIPAWKRVKAEFFLQGLVQYGFVTAP